MKSLAQCWLYGIVDLGYVAPNRIESVAEQMIEGGIDVLQLRAKGVPEPEVEKLGWRLAAVTGAAGVPFIINDYPQLVASVGAQGAHVGQDDFSIEDARWRAARSLSPHELPPVIGQSTHSVAQALAAARAGADYIGFGPLFSTPTKPGRPAIGLDEIQEVHELVNIPIFCIGGIRRENLEEVIRAGARRVVVVSAILQAAEVVSCCREVKETLARSAITSGG